MKKHLIKVGDLLEIEAIDHTTSDNDWSDRDDLLKINPEILQVAGYYLGETRNTFRLAMCKVGDSYGTQFIVLKKAIIRLGVRK